MSGEAISLSALIDMEQIEGFFKKKLKAIGYSVFFSNHIHYQKRKMSTDF